MTENLLRSEGYGSITARKVASEVGVTSALVHYYYPTLDDLLLATFERAAKRCDDAIIGALTSDQPLHNVWKIVSAPGDPRSLGAELFAMANHRPAVRERFVEYQEKWRTIVSRLCAGSLAAAGAGKIAISPLCGAALIGSLGLGILMEKRLGLTLGHDELQALALQLIDAIEPPREKALTP